MVSAFAAVAEEPVEYFSVGNPVRFDNTDFYLAWSSHPQENYYIQEYLPKGETLEHYNRMYTVSVHFSPLTPLDAVRYKIADLQQRKESDPLTSYSAVENDCDYVLEFLVSDSHDGMVHILEKDFHHYQQMTIDGREALVLSFYSARAYDNDVVPFMESVFDKRGDWYRALLGLNIRPRFL